MTVSTTTARNVKSPNGSTTSFPFDFTFDVEGDLAVTRVVIATAVETLQTLTTDYTVTGGSGATGTIEMNTAPPGPALENLVIERATPKTQSVDYQPNDPFPAEVNETALDKLTRIEQETLDLVDRAVKLKKNSTLAGPTIPDPEVNKVLVGKTTTEFENKTISDLDPTVTALPLSIANGGTNAATASAARTNLGAGTLDDVVGDTSPQLGGVLDTNDFAIDESKGTNVASGSSTNVWVTDGNTVHITGTGTINDFATAPRVGATRRCIADGAFTLADSATIIVPGNANFTIAVDTTFEVYAETTTTFRIRNLQKADGTAVVASVQGITSISNVAIGAVTNVDVTGFLPGTYDNYEVWISNSRPGNDVVILDMETSTDGGSSFDTGASDYTWATGQNFENAVATDSGAADDTEIQLTGAGNTGFAANENTGVKLFVFSPEATEFTLFTWFATMRNNSGAFSVLAGGGERQSAADVDALRFHWSAGDWIAQGNIQFLGLQQ